MKNTSRLKLVSTSPAHAEVVKNIKNVADSNQLLDFNISPKSALLIVSGQKTENLAHYFFDIVQKKTAPITALTPQGERYFLR